MKKSSKDLGISERISQLRKHFALSYDALADKVGASGQTIANIEQGKSSNPGAELPVSISSILGIRLDWLSLGEGEMLKGTPSKADPQNNSLYNAADLFPKEAPMPGEEDDSPADTTEIHGQIVQTRLPPGLGTGTRRKAPGKMLVQEFIEAVVNHEDAITQLRQELLALKRQVNKG